MEANAARPLPKVVIYTDGSCRPNPGPGGWSAILIFGKHEKHICGGIAAETTNNRMEILAVIKALRELKVPCAVTLWSDSQYVLNGLEKFVAASKRNNWRDSGGQPIRNADLWQELDKERERHTIILQWVRGHSGNTYNELADGLANRGRMEALENPLAYPEITVPPLTLSLLDYAREKLDTSRTMPSPYA